MCDLERARPKKMCDDSFSKKAAEESKKGNLLIFEAPKIKRVSYLCFHSEHTDATVICCYYKYFIISLQIKSSLVLVITYCKDLAFK